MENNAQLQKSSIMNLIFPFTKKKYSQSLSILVEHEFTLIVEFGALVQKTLDLQFS